MMKTVRAVMLSSPFTQAYAEFLGFIQILNKAVQGKKVSDDVPSSPVRR